MERKTEKAPRERRLGSLKHENPSGDFTKVARVAVHFVFVLWLRSNQLVTALVAVLRR